MLLGLRRIRRITSSYVGENKEFGGAPAHIEANADPMDEQLRRTVIAWSLVADSGEECVLWDLDKRVGVERPWGLGAARVAEIDAAVSELQLSRT